MDFDDAVDELYGMDPSEFTARRDALASQARQEGDKELATALKALRKPSAAAFTVNLMARSRPDEITHLTELGARMREAQAALSGEELRALGRQRQQLIAGLAQEARRVARQAGHPVSEAVGREVEATFEAALADAAAGEAVLQGRLIRALEHTGMDAVELAGAVAGGAGAGGAVAAGTGAAGRGGTGTGKGGMGKGKGGAGKDKGGAETGQGGKTAAEDARQQERARAELQRAEEQAERAAEAEQRAQGRVAASVAELEAAQRRVAETEEEIIRLERQQAEARADGDRAVEAERRARRERQAAEDEAEDAAAAARRARDRVEGLRAQPG